MFQMLKPNPTKIKPSAKPIPHDHKAVTPTTVPSLILKKIDESATR
jgi:hypothetical protein